MAEARAPKKSLPKINPVDGPFWEGAAKDKFLLQKCKACGKLQFFPRVVCVDCFRRYRVDRGQRHRQNSHLHAGARAAQSGVQRRSADLLYQCDSRRRRDHRKPLLGDNKEKVKIGDRVKVRYEQTHNPEIKLPCFELV